MFRAAIVLSSLLFSVAIAFAGQSPAQEDRAEKLLLARLEKEHSHAKTLFSKSPKDPKARAKYVAASNRLAYASMQALSLGPKVKYPKALRLYRDVLKVDPKNSDAIRWKKQIEDIYRSMGRPIPK